jgi:hypothetical protein
MSWHLNSTSCERHLYSFDHFQVLQLDAPTSDASVALFTPYAVETYHDEEASNLSRVSPAGMQSSGVSAPQMGEALPGDIQPYYRTARHGMIARIGARPAGRI